ncbi:MAG: YbjN domain-containing protein [Frankiaceae bacterium]|nr:YbjN domain-containing protein [Frankiaceae bacterium]
MFRRRARSADPAAADEPPDAGARRGPWAPASRPGIPVVPTTAMLEQILDEYALDHEIDADGDLMVRHDNCAIYFLYFGRQRQILQARMYLDRRFDVDMRMTLIGALDDWNRRRLFPKAYTVLPDDGQVGICATCAFDFEAGATRAQLKYTVGAWIDSLLQFARWIDRQTQ